MPQQAAGQVGAVVHEARPGDAEQAKVTIIRDGLKREIQFYKGQPSILDCASAAGLEVPVIPGIMPIQNIEQVQRITAMCGAHVPGKLAAAMKVRKDDPDAAIQLGVAYATLQCADLLRRGVPGVHFYTLNRSPATRAILATVRAAEPWVEADG